MRALAVVPDQIIEPNADLQACADAISGEWRKTLDGIFATGQRIIKAKERLPFGQFGRLFVDSLESVDRPVPFGIAAAEMLMQITRDPTLGNPNFSWELPPNKKHVSLEKPMALNLRECDEILEVTNKNSVFLQLGFMRRFDPEFVAAFERINAGEIGQPMMIKSNTHGPGLPPAWARDLRSSNGMLAEDNSHDWDTLRWFMGSNLHRVYTEVANFKGAANNVDTPNFYDNALVNVKFENGGLGMISGICPCGYGYDARVEIVGEKGIMQIGKSRAPAMLDMRTTAV